MSDETYIRPDYVQAFAQQLAALKAMGSAPIDLVSTVGEPVDEFWWSPSRLGPVMPGHPAPIVVRRQRAMEDMPAVFRTPDEACPWWTEDDLRRGQALKDAGMWPKPGPILGPTGAAPYAGGEVLMLDFGRNRRIEAEVAASNPLIIQSNLAEMEDQLTEEVTKSNDWVYLTHTPIKARAVPPGADHHDPLANWYVLGVKTRVRLIL